MSRFTRVCSYDRAGQGFSDAGPLPRDTDALVGDLHALLHAAGLKPPYVYVGHSLAGLDGVLFADRYLSELAGIVLVDPSFAHQNDALARIPALAPPSSKGLLSLKSCEDAARAHVLPTDPKLVDLCLDHDPTYTPALTTANDRIALRPDYWTDMQSEGKSFNATPGGRDIDSPELDAAARDFGRLDLVVLTASAVARTAGMSQTVTDAEFKAWNAGHDAIAARSRNGHNEIVARSSHYIQFDHPHIVVEAIHGVVLKARGLRAGPGKP